MDTPKDPREDAEAGERLWGYIAERMEAVGIRTYRELERRSGVAYSTIYAYKAGRQPDLDAGGRLARALGVSYQDLLRARSGLPQTQDQLQAMIRETAEEAVERAIRRLRREGWRPPDDEPGRR